MAKTSFNHSQPAPAIELVPRIDRRRARAAEHCSAALANCRELGLQGRVREGVSTFDLADDAVNSERMVDISYGWLTGSD